MDTTRLHTGTATLHLDGPVFLHDFPKGDLASHRFLKAAPAFAPQTRIVLAFAPSGAPHDALMRISSVLSSAGPESDTVSIQITGRWCAMPDEDGAEKNVLLIEGAAIIHPAHTAA